MKFPWSRRRTSPAVIALQEEVEQARRAVEATRPIVEEAVRRTNDSFIAVEQETRHARDICILIRDLTEGFNGHG